MKKSISRRDFFKISAMTALSLSSLPVYKVFGDTSSSFTGQDSNLQWSFYRENSTIYPKSFSDVGHQYQLDNEYGDIGIWMKPAKYVDDVLFSADDEKDYLSQSLLAAGEAQVKALKLLKTSDGQEIKTWDNTNYPLEKRAFAHHVQPLKRNHILNGELCSPGYSLLLLRFKPSVKIDLQAFVEFDYSIAESLPSDRYHVPIDELSGFFNGRISQDEFTPMKGPEQTLEEYFNPLNPKFWNKRLYNCSTLTTWAMNLGMFVAETDEGQQKTVDEFMNKDRIISNDLMAPGNVGSFLIENNLAEIIGKPIQF